MAYVCVTVNTGSISHSWGILPWKTDAVKLFRFVPTLVRNTGLRTMQMYSPDGSSPHSWGILSDLEVVLLHPRFIPTLVGNTAKGWCVP